MIKKIFLILMLATVLNNNLKSMIPVKTCKADAYDAFDSRDYENGNPYLMQFIFDGANDIFIMSVEMGGGSVEYKNNAGITSLMLAAAKDSLLTVQIICLRASSDFIVKTDNLGLHVLDHAIINGRQGIVDYLRSLSVNWD